MQCGATGDPTWGLCVRVRYAAPHMRDRRDEHFLSMSLRDAPYGNHVRTRPPPPFPKDAALPLLQRVRRDSLPHINYVQTLSPSTLPKDALPLPQRSLRNKRRQQV
jgi:hypothetical protein